MDSCLWTKACVSLWTDACQSSCRVWMTAWFLWLPNCIFCPPVGCSILLNVRLCQLLLPTCRTHPQTPGHWSIFLPVESAKQESLTAVNSNKSTNTSYVLNEGHTVMHRTSGSVVLYLHLWIDTCTLVFLFPHLLLTRNCSDYKRDESAFIHWLLYVTCVRPAAVDSFFYMVWSHWGLVTLCIQSHWSRQI